MQTSKRFYRSMATSFHLFPLLPFELRAQIWGMTNEPRTVKIRYSYKDLHAGNHATSPTPVPSVMHACKESRRLAPYQRAFCYGDRPRYTWVNFDTDTISLDEKSGLKLIKDEKPFIRRLEFERQNDEWFFHYESEDMFGFDKVEAINVVCLDGLVEWAHGLRLLYWPCPRENITFVDKETGQMANNVELIKLEDEWEEELEARNASNSP